MKGRSRQGLSQIMGDGGDARLMSGGRRHGPVRVGSTRGLLSEGSPRLQRSGPSVVEDVVWRGSFLAHRTNVVKSRLWRHVVTLSPKIRVRSSAQERSSCSWPLHLARSGEIHNSETHRVAQVVLVRIATASPFLDEDLGHLPSIPVIWDICTGRPCGAAALRKLCDQEPAGRSHQVKDK